MKAVSMIKRHLKKPFVIEIILVIISSQFLVSCSKPNTVKISGKKDITPVTYQVDRQVSATGKVIEILPDFTSGTPYQRFILQTDSRKLHIVHNIEVAERISNLCIDDSVTFNGKYEQYDSIEIIYSTHHASSDKYKSGWLKHKGKLYQ